MLQVESVVVPGSIPLFPTYFIQRNIIGTAVIFTGTLTLRAHIHYATPNVGVPNNECLMCPPVLYPPPPPGDFCRPYIF